MLKGVYIASQDVFDLVFSTAERRTVARHIEIHPTPIDPRALHQHSEMIAAADVILSTWGMPTVDHSFLALASRLKAIFYAAGTIGGWMTPAAVERGIMICTAQGANAIPVAEYTTSMILLSLKQAFQFARQVRQTQSHPNRNQAAGCYGSTVGLIGYGEIARAVRERLRCCDLNVMVFDPYLGPRVAGDEDITLCSLKELFFHSNVVSLHAPSLPETMGMVTEDHIRSMPRNATFINTARGELVQEEGLLDVLEDRPDLQAVLDVTAQEPPAANSRIYVLDNVIHTPHLAGSVGAECKRMGKSIVTDLVTYLSGRRPAGAVDLGRIQYTSHRLMQLQVPAAV